MIWFKFILRKVTSNVKNNFVTTKKVRRYPNRYIFEKGNALLVLYLKEVTITSNALHPTLEIWRKIDGFNGEVMQADVVDGLKMTSISWQTWDKKKWCGPFFIFRRFRFIFEVPCQYLYHLDLQWKMWTICRVMLFFLYWFRNITVKIFSGHFVFLKHAKPYEITYGIAA